MKVEVLCPSCSHSYVVDEESIDPTAVVPCPACGDHMGVVEVPATEALAAPVAAAATAQPLPTPAAAAGLDQEVVCPRCSLHFNPQRHRRVEAAPNARKTILVVEDMEYFLQIAKDALSEKFEVKTARTFDGAWAILAAGGIDLLVLDLTLEGSENGKLLLEQIKFKPCPILIFTAKDESEMYGEWQELQALGADDMVLKGMQVGESLVKKACQLLEVPNDEGELG
jgi:CheY-like chemotaxis protein